jgi:hypothetical protein
MPLPPDFQFSQSSLQDYTDCPRRFELRYMMQLKWPALQSEPYLEQEKHMEQGQRFHHSIHQYIIGLPQTILSVPEEENVDLLRWWNNFLSSSPLATYPGKLYPEFSLSMAFEGFRLTAKYDVIISSEKGNFVIFDWKTSRKRQPLKFLKIRMQSRVYPFVLVNAGLSLNGNKPINPDQLEMIYWFAEYPQDLEKIIYNQDQYQHDYVVLSNIIHEINSTPDKNFAMTLDMKKCNYCNYRSLCDRGVQAGDWNEMEDSDPQDLPGYILFDDLDGIPEIEF